VSDLFIAKKSEDNKTQKVTRAASSIFLTSFYYMVSQALLRLFQAKKPAFGAWLTVSNGFIARTVAQASPHLSWMVIDCEHGLISLVPGAAEAVTAIQGAVPNGGPTPIVRIPATGISASSSWQIKHALDGGARGVLVPMVRKSLL
jgi:4-hydroxy-2-oxoheptanedioate aldolase